MFYDILSDLFDDIKESEGAEKNDIDSNDNKGGDGNVKDIFGNNTKVEQEDRKETSSLDNKKKGISSDNLDTLDELLEFLKNS